MMKMIIETPKKVESVITESKEGKKDFYIEGVFATPNVPNNNGRIYPREIWQKVIEDYMVHITTPTSRSLMEWEHSEKSYVNPMNSVAKIEALYLDGNYVVGKAKLLDNPKADILKDIISNGISIGVSSRGIGDFDHTGRIFDFELITFDCVSDPSDAKAYVGKSSLTESFVRGVNIHESYKRNDKGVIELVNNADIANNNDKYAKEIINFLKNM